MKYDAVVVGAGVAGCFTAYKLASAGLRVALVERKPEEKIGEKVCGDAIGEHHFRNTDLEPPTIGVDADGVFEGVVVYSPSEKYKLLAEGRGYALRRKEFGQRLLKLAVNAGAELYSEHHAKSPIISDSWVRGVEVIREGEGSKKLKARLVVDASGAQGVIRSRVPKEWWVYYEVPREDYNICYREVLELDIEVQTEYAEIYLDPEVAPGGYWWLFPKTKNVVNLGIGVQWKAGNPNPMEQYLKHVKPRFERHVVRVLHSGGGIVPTRRTMPCMVWNGLLVVGDAACTANPIHGGGIGPALMSALKASETAIEALENAGEASLEALWPYHKRYFEAYGAKQAALDVLRMFLQKLSRDDLEFVMEKGIVNNQELLKIGYDGELRLSILDKLGFALRLLARPTLLRGVAKVKEYMDKARKLYLDFPDSPNGYPEWREREEKLFSEYKSWVEGL